MDVTKKLTIVIPVRIDCIERKENLDTIIHSLLMTTEAQIIILEADDIRKYNNVNFEKNKKLRYVFIEDRNLIFHRTHYLNQLLRMSKTDIVGVWDTDVFLRNEQLKIGIQEIIKGATICYPFDGRFIFLDSSNSSSARMDILSFLNDRSNDELSSILGRPSVGGAFIVNKKRYLQSGGENEVFYGWGPEDAERYKRMEILGEPISRISGPLYHLHHPRGINSSPDFGLREKSNIEELISICNMDKGQLTKYINGWNKKNRALRCITPKKNKILDDDLVSVVMPIYNTEAYLDNSIRSILEQTYSNFEFIIIDDGSTDGSLEIVNKYDDKRIRVVRNKHNRGNYVRRNQGIKLSKGKYIAVMDSDDIAMPHRLEAQINTLKSDKRILAAGSQYYSDWGFSKNPLDYEMIKIELMRNNIINHPSHIVRSEVIKDIGGYNESYLYSSDYNLVCKIALKGMIVNLPDILIKYTSRKEQISTLHNYKQASFADQIRLKYLEKICIILSDIEKSIFSKVMTFQAISDEEKILYTSSIEKIDQANQKISFFDNDALVDFFINQPIF